MVGLSGLAGSARFAVLGLWVMRGIWSLSLHLWLAAARCGGLTMLIYSLPLPSPRAPFLRRMNYLRVLHYVIDCLNMMNA